MGEWPEYPLETFVDPERSICYGIVQPGKPQEDGVPIVRVNNFKEGHIDARDALKIDPEIENKYQRSRLRGGELLLTLVGSMGLSAIVPDELRGWNVARAVGVVPLKENVDKRWLNFVLRSQPSQDFIQTHANTTVQATFNLRDLARLPIPMPPDGVRLPASQLLSALDDKIELNRRMNETLEGMARALFKDWFVDFGPTRAKAEGRTPYLAPKIWSLFPKTLDDEDKPVGWELHPVSNFAKIKGGKQLTKDKFVERGPVPVFGGAGLMGHTDQHNADGFVISVGRVGAYCGQFFSYRGKAWINNNASLIVPDEGVSGEWLLLALRALDIDLIKKGAAQPFVSNSDIAAMRIIDPGQAVNKSFHEWIGNLVLRQEANERESSVLAQTCDLLLPKLMSGEIRLVEAEKAVEAVG